MSYYLHLLIKKTVRGIYGVDFKWTLSELEQAAGQFSKSLN